MPPIIKWDSEHVRFLTKPEWGMHAAILAGQRVKATSNIDRTIRLWNLWNFLVASPLRLAEKAAKQRGLDAEPFLIWMVDHTFWWVR